MISNIADTLSHVARQKGYETALIEAKSGRSLSFKEIDNTVNQYASFFDKQGVKQGQRVMLMVKPSAEFICLTFALFKLGAPVILIDPGMGYKNLLKCIKGVKPDYLIGIPKAIIFKTIFRNTFSSIKKSFSCGSLLGLTGKNIIKQIKKPLSPVPVFTPDQSSLAAIIFTTGSTGPPKGVRFEHSIFDAQLKLIKRYYDIGPKDIDQPGFPLFGLFSIALGACAVIPDMDPTRPADVDPVRFINSIQKYGVTYSFGSPAIWNVVSAYCIKNNITCPTLKKVLMAGAPVSGELVRRVYNIMPDGSQIHTPYGATECLPIVSIEGKEIIKDTWDHTCNGKGTCVGRTLPGIEIKIIKAKDGPVESFSACEPVEPGVIGEIIVKGDVVTRAYENNDTENILSKISDLNGFWHRIGDVGYIDNKNRLWFCGRKAHRVKSRTGIMYTIPCEAVINTHPDILRSALVGIPAADGFETPVFLVEMKKDVDKKDAELLRELEKMACAHHLTKNVKNFMIHPAFPVDIRHNAKIFREQLQEWASKKNIRKL